MDRARLAEFLRSRRESVQPEEVGLPRGRRRRTPGLRRDEVAALSGISTDYYTRIEQPRGPLPTDDVLDAIARGLRLNPSEREHLFRLAGHVPAGHTTAGRAAAADRTSPGLLRIFERLDDTPAMIVNDLGETLHQTPLAIALLGDETSYAGPRRSRVYRWFTDPTTRSQTPREDHPAHSRALVALIGRAAAGSGRGSRANVLVARLRRESTEFEALWRQHPVAAPYCEAKTILNDRVGELVLHGQTLLDPEGSQALTVFTAEPGSDSERRLQTLARGLVEEPLPVG